MTRDLILTFNGEQVGRFQIVRRDAECWDWAWQRPDNEIVVGTETTEAEAAASAGREMVSFYEGMN